MWSHTKETQEKFILQLSWKQKRKLYSVNDFSNKRTAETDSTL